MADVCPPRVYTSTLLPIVSQLKWKGATVGPAGETRPPSSACFTAVEPNGVFPMPAVLFVYCCLLLIYLLCVVMLTVCFSSVDRLRFVLTSLFRIKRFLFLFFFFFWSEMSENYSPGHLSLMTALIDTVDTCRDTLWEAFGKPFGIDVLHCSMLMLMIALPSKRVQLNSILLLLNETTRN